MWTIPPAGDVGDAEGTTGALGGAVGIAVAAGVGVETIGLEVAPDGPACAPHAQTSVNRQPHSR